MRDDKFARGQLTSQLCSEANQPVLGATCPAIKRIEILIGSIGYR